MGAEVRRLLVAGGVELNVDINFHSKTFESLNLKTALGYFTVHIAIRVIKYVAQASYFYNIVDRRCTLGLKVLFTCIQWFEYT